MNKKILFYLIVLISKNVFSQNDSNIVKFSFENTPLIEVIYEIEKKTNYSCYFINEWFDGITINKFYKEGSLKEVLNDILKETSFNFYINEKNKVIVFTENNFIYDSLPKAFFKSVNPEVKHSFTSSPFFYNDNDENSTTLKIGKDSGSLLGEKFILSGYVIDQKTKEPIQGAKVIAVYDNEFSMTNDEGKYKLFLSKGKKIIKVEFIGMEKKKKEILLYNKGELNFQLNTSYEKLEEIVLKVKKEVKSEAISGISTIDVAKIKNIPTVFGEADIFKVATTLPGITSAGEGASGYNVRGGKTDQNLILLDNMVIYKPTHFFGMFSGINPYILKSIDIYKGSIPSEFGGRLSSVFDIKSKEGSLKEFKGEASLGLIMSSLKLEIPVLKEKSSLIVGGRKTYSNWILRSLNTDELNKSQASFYDLSLGYTHKLSKKTSFKINGYMSKDYFNISSDSLFTYKNRALSLSADHKFNKKNKLNTILTNSSYNFDVDYNKDNLDGFKLEYGINETELKLKFSYLKDKKHNFNYGLSSKIYLVNPGNLLSINAYSSYASVDLPKEKALESALFISDNIKLGDKFISYLGFRYSNFLFLGPIEQRSYQEGLPKNTGTLESNKSYGNNEIVSTYNGLEARLSLKYFLSDDLSTKISFNKSNQYIHTLSNNTTNSPIDTWKLSDLNIKPQTSQLFSLGFYQSFKDDIFKVSLEGYYKTLNNILDFKTGAQLFLNEEIETQVLQGKGKSYGLEFILEKKVGDLTGWFSYTYSKSLNKFDSDYPSETINRGQYFPSNYDKPHDLSLVANYKLTQRYSLSLNGVYQTGRPVTYPIAKYVYDGVEYVAYSDRNKFRIPDYYRLDLSLNIEGNHKIKKLAHSFWNISVYNVLGRNNPYSVFFVTEDSEVKAYQSSIFSVPIPTISYNIKF